MCSLPWALFQFVPIEGEYYVKLIEHAYATVVTSTACVRAQESTAMLYCRLQDTLLANGYICFDDDRWTCSWPCSQTPLPSFLSHHV